MDAHPLIVAVGENFAARSDLIAEVSGDRFLFNLDLLLFGHIEEGQTDVLDGLVHLYQAVLSAIAGVTRAGAEPICAAIIRIGVDYLEPIDIRSEMYWNCVQGLV